MKEVKVAINGFGRIGRAFYRLASQCKDINVVAINDLSNIENLKYLLKYDTNYGLFVDTNIDNVLFLQEKEPENLPWKDLGVDIVVESTGFFRDLESASKHKLAGAKRVVISAPSPDAPTVLVGVNTSELANFDVTSNASCTTNAINPIVAVLSEQFGIKKAILNTIHSYTSTQRTVDTSSPKDFRRGRAAAANIIPTSTGAAKATAKVHTQLLDKFDGISVRVPTPVGSLIDLTLVTTNLTSVQEINNALEEAANSDKWRNFLAVEHDPVVSSDIVGRTEASIVDLQMTRVIDGDLVKVLSWYDNEMGYTRTLLEHVRLTAEFI